MLADTCSGCGHLSDWHEEDRGTVSGRCRAHECECLEDVGSVARLEIRRKSLADSNGQRPDFASAETDEPTLEGFGIEPSEWAEFTAASERASRRAFRRAFYLFTLPVAAAAASVAFPMAIDNKYSPYAAFAWCGFVALGAVGLGWLLSEDAGQRAKRRQERSTYYKEVLLPYVNARGDWHTAQLLKRLEEARLQTAAASNERNSRWRKWWPPVAAWAVATILWATAAQAYNHEEYGIEVNTRSHVLFWIIVSVAGLYAAIQGWELLQGGLRRQALLSSGVALAVGAGMALFFALQIPEPYDPRYCVPGGTRGSGDAVSVADCAFPPGYVAPPEYR